MAEDQNMPNENREAMDRLNELNRIQLEARMLPRSKKLTPEQIAGVVDAYKTYTETRGIRNAQVAREINYSSAVLSSWLKGDYKGDVSAVTFTVNDWLERDARRADAARPKDYVETWVAETMRMIAAKADQMGVMAAIVAPAGSGKTMVLKALAEEMRGVYHYCDADDTPRDFLLSLAKALGRQAETGSKASIKNYIIKSLKGTRRVIFLDEAHQLGKSINSVRGIYDQAGVPIVMAGTADILNMIGDHSHGRGQFHSRCIPFNVVDHVRSADDPDGGKAGGRSLFTIEEIRKFFEMKKIRLNTDGLRLMWALACLPSQGTLRLIDHLATLAAAISDEAVLTRESVVAALNLLRGRSGAKHLVTMAERHEGGAAIAAA